jgi:MerR family mercuric resistance operon transcriptional regulator
MELNMANTTIGKVAKAAGIGVETIRFYERRGLLAEPLRSDSGYRLYPKSTVHRLRFIRRAKSLGFTLAEIGELLSYSASPAAGCQDVRDRARVKIVDIDDRVSQLLAMKKALEGLVEQCSGVGPATECPILEALEEEGS